MTRRIAIIPARGGSKRLPRKNILPFLGRPMIVHTIEAARGSGLFDCVAVSTEDKAIAAVAADAGARIIDRPLQLASDTATVNQVILASLEALEAKDELFDEVCCLYATAPLRTSEDIVASHKRLLEPGVEFVMAVCRYSMPPYRALIEDAAGHLTLFYPEHGTRQSQSMPHLVVNNGSTYWARVPRFCANKSFYGPGMVGYEMPLLRSVDIDTQEDLDIALAFAAARGTST